MVRAHTRRVVAKPWAWRRKVRRKGKMIPDYILVRMLR